MMLVSIFTFSSPQLNVYLHTFLYITLCELTGDENNWSVRQRQKALHAITYFLILTHLFSSSRTLSRWSMADFRFQTAAVS